jgi:hypothetical protein
MQVGDPPRLEFRWEVSNVPHAHEIDLPNCISFGNPTFGRILSANNPRELQFAVRLAF